MPWLRHFALSLLFVATLFGPANTATYALASIAAGGMTGPGLAAGGLAVSQGGRVLSQMSDDVASGLSRAGAAGGALRFGGDDVVYGPSARGALRALQERAGGRLLTDVGGPAAGQSWTQFSIQTLERQLAAGGRVRFDLTHVDDLAGVLRGTGSHAGTVTAQELRFLRANWGRFQGNVTFYRAGAEVAAPW